MALVVTAPEIAATLAETGVAPLFETTIELRAAVQHVSGSRVAAASAAGAPARAAAESPPAASS